MFRRLFLLTALLISFGLHAQTVAERYLFSAVNQERAAAGLPPLTWNPQLANAARYHAMQMAQHGSISHQFSGEADLMVRASSSGAKFSRVAENVGVSSSALQMHDAWMRSTGHRANIMDANVTSMGIAVIARGGSLWAVEDFARDVEGLSLEQQEQRVASLIAETANMQNVVATTEARKTCSTQSGFAGAQRPAFVMRYSASDLSRLPDQLTTRLQTGNFTQVAVGACPTRKSTFAGYSIAVLLFR